MSWTTRDNTPEENAALYLEAARRDLASNERRSFALCEHLPPDVMPSAEQLEAVYLATGKTDGDRRAASAHFRPSAATQSAWCRSMLKRAALLQAAAAL